MENIYQDNDLRIQAKFPNKVSNAGKVLISFTGIGHALGGIDIQKPEFYGSGEQFENILFISDLKRSWGNNLNIEKVIELITPYIEGARIFSIGNSMGGFLSIYFSSALKTEVSVSFCPQFSVNPEYIKGERRWEQYIENIKHHKVTCANDYFNDETQYYIFSGSKGPDLIHANSFDIRKNLIHYLFSDAGHNLAKRLKADQRLYKTIEDCFSKKSELDFHVETTLLSPEKLK